MSLLRRRLLCAAPLLGLAARASALDAPSGSVVLTISGAVTLPNREGRADFDMGMLERLPQRNVHTETPWYSAARSFSGPLLRDVLAAAGAKGRALRLVALNDYRVEIPFDDVQRYDVVLARQLDRKPMSVREKGPLFVMYPFDAQPQLRNAVYFSRCIWQLRSIELV
ncbi:MAG: hypothetical protein V4792_14880 [Pseudomonadota bacterium]